MAGTDLSYVQRAVDDIVEALRCVTSPVSRHHSVVIRSTVPPGTVDDVVIPVLAAGLAGTEISVGTAIARNSSGRALGSLTSSPRPLLSWAQPTLRSPGRLPIVCLPRPARAGGPRPRAEALKYACNAFHATKVSFTNEVSRLFRLLGVDSREVMSLFVEDHVLNISASYLHPGFAFGGSCLPKDLRSLLHLAA